jgi:hypothetical protein
MYVHGALPMMAKFRLRRHLRRCTTCQNRFATLLATSQALADTVRGDELPRWTPPVKSLSSTLPVAGAMSLIVVLLALLGVLTTTFWVKQVQANGSQPTTASQKLPALTTECEVMEPEYAPAVTDTKTPATPHPASTPPTSQATKATALLADDEHCR